MTRIVAIRRFALTLLVLLTASGAGLAFAKSTAGWHSVFTKANVQLTGVSCISAKSCFAVGAAETDSTDSIWRLSGGKWRGVDVKPFGVSGVGIEGPADVVDAHGVSCVAAGCMTVGSASDDTATAPVATWWNGRSWKKLAPISTGFPVTPESFSAVSCVSKHACIAVGYGLDGSKAVGISETWNGSRWSLVSMPTPVSDAENVEPESVACVGASNCWAVGFYFTETAMEFIAYAEHWNGKRWTVGVLPRTSFSANASAESALADVSCPTAKNCTAVGGVAGSLNTIQPPQALVEHWNGKHWSIELHKAVKGATGASLQGVACTRESCVAVGAAAHNKPGSKAGGWTGLVAKIVGSKITPLKITTSYADDDTDEFYSVTCPRSCVAVGYGYPYPIYKSFIYDS
jgi:hypothetical protein